LENNKGTRENILSKKGIVIKLYKDGFIDERTFWNLLGAKFKKSELCELEETFRKYSKRGNPYEH